MTRVKDGYIKLVGLNYNGDSDYLLKSDGSVISLDELGNNLASDMSNVVTYEGETGSEILPVYVDENGSVKAGAKFEEFIIGTQTATTGTWTGVSKDTELYDGKIITYWLPYNGSGNATLNLTLANGTTTGAKNCYINGTSRITTHFNAGYPINLIYRENVKIGSNTYTGWWACDRDSDTKGILVAGSIKAAAAITANNIIVGTSAGYKHLKSGEAFDMTYPILYTTYAISSGSTNSWSCYSAHVFDITTTQNITLTAYKEVYIVGTLSGNMFTPISTTPITQTRPTSDDGNVYILLGLATSTTKIYMHPEHPVYAYKNGLFVTWIGYALLGNSLEISDLSTDTSWINPLLVKATANDGNTFGTDTDLLYQPSTNTLKVTTLQAAEQVNSPLFYYNMTSASADPVLYIGSKNVDTTLMRVYSSGASDTNYKSDYGFSLKYIGTGAGNANYLNLYADNLAATNLELSISIDLEGNVGIKQNPISGYSISAKGKMYAEDLEVEYAAHANAFYENGVSLADKYALKSIVDNVVTHTDGFIGGSYYYAHHPEALKSIIPFLYNDLAWTLQRGGSISIYTTSSTDFTLINLTVTSLKSFETSGLFNCSPSYTNITVDSLNDVLVLDIVCPEMYTYSNMFYIDFGTLTWRAKNISVYAWHNSNPTESYTLINNITNNALEAFRCIINYSFNNSTGTLIQGFNRLRIVLTNFVTTSPKIAEIGIIKYNSPGLRSGFMSKGIDDFIYRNITPNSTHYYNLGSEVRLWNNVYASTFIGKLHGRLNYLTDPYNYIGFYVHRAGNASDLVGSTEVEGAWGYPENSQDSAFGNGSVMRMNWAGDYYTDIFTGPNDAGNTYGLLWRQIVNSVAKDWRILLDTTNCSTYVLPLTGGTLTGLLTLAPSSFLNTIKFANTDLTTATAIAFMGNENDFVIRQTLSSTTTDLRFNGTRLQYTGSAINIVNNSGLTNGNGYCVAGNTILRSSGANTIFSTPNLTGSIYFRTGGTASATGLFVFSYDTYNYFTSSTTLKFKIASTDLMTITTTGVTVLGTITAQGGKFYTNTDGAYWTSDRRFKEDIHSPVKSGLLEDETGFIRKFNWKDTGKSSYGYIAQELLPIIPEAVDYNVELNKYSVNYSVAHSAAIAQLVIKIKELEAAIKQLKLSIN